MADLEGGLVGTLAVVEGAQLRAPNHIDGAAVIRHATVKGALLRNPSIVTPDIEAALYTLPDLLTPVAQLTLSRDRQWLDPLSEAGSASIALQNDDTALALFADDSAVGFSYKGVRAFTMLCEAMTRVSIDPNEEAKQVTTWAGRGLLAVVEPAQMYPSLGVGSLPIEEDRPFGWQSPVFDDSGWGFATVITNVATAKLVMGWDPNFPDDTAAVQWGPPGDLTNAPAGSCYYRATFTVSNTGLHLLSALIDNAGVFFLDGQQMLYVPTFLTTSSVLVFLSAGTHYLAYRATNAVQAVGNPAGVAWTLFETDQGGQPVGSPVAHSSSADLCVPYPAAPPGMTPGRVIRLVVEEAQARGVLADLELNFTDTTDSAGQPWPVTAEIATRVGTDYLTFFRELAGTYVDLWMEPTRLRLWAWNYGTRGVTRAIDFHPPTNPANPLTGNISALTHKREILKTNTMLVRWSGGWTEDTDPAQIAADGRSEARFDLGAPFSIEEVLRVVDNELAKFSARREQITIGITPRSDSEEPYLAWWDGDTFTVPDSTGAPTSERVLATGITEIANTGRAVVTVTFKDAILGALERISQDLRKRQ